MKDDGHGPKYGCTYQVCGNPSAEKRCPFVKDETGMTFIELPIDVDHMRSVAKSKCEHEWRQLVDVEPHGFYCIRCLTISPSKVQHDIIPVINRGEPHPE